MIQESTRWDWRQLPVLSSSMRIYLLFLFVIVIVTATKLLRAWRTAPPFRLSRQAGNPTYIRSLRASSTSLKHWAAFVFLGWGICTCTSVHEFCVRLLDENRVGSFVILLAVLGFASTLTMTLLVVLFMLLVRWHLIQRIENLGSA